MSKQKHCETIKAWADGAEIEVMNLCGTWDKTLTPKWFDDMEYRVKPEKAYPVTQMTDIELQAAVDISDQSVIGCAKNISNAALRHAIDAGQVVPIDEVMTEVDRVVSENRAVRDMAIAEAVINECARQTHGDYMFDRVSARLAAIIAQVKP